MAFSANNHIHFDTGDEGNFVVNSNNIHLGLEGDKNSPAEHAVLGNNFIYLSKRVVLFDSPN